MSTPARDRLRLSVVIPARNEEHHLARCLDALSQQTDPVDEIIVVDNASTDCTAAIALQRPGVILLREPSPGVTHARNRGLDAASGDLLARIDADTVVSTQWAAAVRAGLHDARALKGLAGPAGLVSLSTPDRPIGCTFYRAFRLVHELAVGAGPLMYGHNMAITRRAWEIVRPIVTTGDADISEDIDVALALLHVGGSVEFRPGMLVTVDMGRTVRPHKLARYYRSDQLTKAKYRRLRAHARTLS